MALNSNPDNSRYKVIPLSAIPDQKFSVTLGGQICQIRLSCEIPGAGFSINENVVASDDGKIAQYAFKSPPALYEYLKANYGKWVVAKVAINIQKWG